jgi:hypothetical protein
MAKKGEHSVHPPEKNEHMKHFDLALKDALSKWEPSDGTELRVRLQAEVSPNPGGIRNYQVILGD